MRPLIELFKRLRVWYGFKDAPKHERQFITWERTPEEPQPLASNVQAPVVEVRPALVSVRQRARFHKMRLELLQDDTWLNSPSQHTDELNVSDITTQPAERDTDVTLHAPAISKLLHERQ